MDPDEITRLVEEMKLSIPRPNEILTLDAAEARIGADRIANILVAKVISPKAINRETFRQQMPRILQATRRINIEAMGDNIFVCEFTSNRDQKRAIADGPWNFFRNLVIFKEPHGWQNPNSMSFDEIAIWVQCHNLPLAFMQGDLLTKVGRRIGVIEELDVGDNDAFLGRFARIREKFSKFPSRYIILIILRIGDSGGSIQKGIIRCGMDIDYKEDFSYHRTHSRNTRCKNDGRLFGASQSRQSNDSTCHSLFFCEAIKHLWKESVFYNTVKAAKWASTSELCGWMSEKFSRGEFEIFAIQTWAIWKVKMDAIHGNCNRLHEANIKWSETFLSDFQEARLVDRPAHKNQALAKKWKQPERCTLKLNVDACVNENLNRYGVGGALRDKQGRLLMAFGKQISKPISVVYGELLAIREGVKLLHEKHFFDVQFATDSLLAVQAVTTTEDNIGYEGSCASEISELLAEPVISDLVQENRLANNVAHSIASFASSSHSPFVWVNGEFFSWLVRLVMDDFK